MKKILKNIKFFSVVSLLLFSAIFTSCDSWLEVKPEDGVTKEGYWKTKEEVYSYLMGCYTALISNGVPAKMYLWGELRGETIAPNRPLSSQQSIMDGDIVSTNSICDWSSVYKAINQCNTLIKYAENVQEEDPSFTDALLNMYVGEAKALRALMYFYLVRTFRDVPYITDAVIEDNQNLQIAKTEGKSILTQEAADLEFVSNYLSSRFNTKAATCGRMTCYGAFALLADMYLWLEDYDGCIRNCNKIINSNQYTLVLPDSSHLVKTEIVDAMGKEDTIFTTADGAQQILFNSLYYEGNSDESIFEIQRETDYPNNDFYNFFYQSGRFMARVDVIRELYFIPSEVERNWYDVRGDDVSYKNGFIWKYLGKSAESSDMYSRDEIASNFILYRLSSVYLMRAEALIEEAADLETSGDTTVKYREDLNQAWKDIRIIRTRANATEMTDLVEDEKSADVASMREFVYEEEIREFMFEGRRWFDALRFAKRRDYGGVERTGFDYLIKMAANSASEDKVFSLRTKLSNRGFHYLPIYENELKANKKLVQNEYYKNY